jgi:GT2 family glycosyltransferase
MNLTNSPKKNVPLGIIVVNYKSHDETVSYVENELAKISTPNVVVIVNNSDDGVHGCTLANALKAQHYHSENMSPVPETDRIVISEPENLGYGPGNNRGFEFIERHFDTDWILISNNDLVLPEPNVVQSLIQAAESDPKIGLIGPRVRTPAGRDQSPHRYKSIWTLLIFPKLFYPVWAILKRFGWGHEVVSNAPSGYYFRIMGCFILVRSEAFAAIEGFDPRTFMYGEECIFCTRLRQKNYETYFSAENNVTHFHSQTTSNYFSNRKLKEQTLRTLLLFFRDYDNQPQWVCKLASFSDWIEAKIYEPILRAAKFLKRSGGSGG